MICLWGDVASAGQWVMVTLAGLGGGRETSGCKWQMQSMREVMMMIQSGFRIQWLQMGNGYGDGGDDSYQDNLKSDLMINEFFRNCVRLFKFLFVHIPYMWVQSLQWSRGIDSRGHRPQNCRIMDPFELLWSLLTKRALSFALNVQWISAGNWLCCIHKIVSSPPPPRCDIVFRINPFPTIRLCLSFSVYVFSMVFDERHFSLFVPQTGQPDVTFCPSVSCFHCFLEEIVQVFLCLLFSSNVFPFLYFALFFL